jgi:S1-C subfamily serine protease
MATNLMELSEALADAVASAGASVVTVHARRRLPASGVTWSADGLVVTADHVIERDEHVRVTLPDGTELPATIAGRDPGSDIAVLRVDRGNLRPIPRAGGVRAGNLVLAVGRPGGGPSASAGIVNVVGGPWRTMRGAKIDGYIRSDVTFLPGFSGGPLVNVAGEMVGLNSSRLGGGQGLTIPASAVSSIVEALVKAGGRLKRGYLGISSQGVRLPPTAAAARDGQETGLLIVSVEAKSPAEQAGVLVGDIIVAIGGERITDTGDLAAALGPDSVGVATAVTVVRAGALQDLTVTIGERA